MSKTNIKINRIFNNSECKIIQFKSNTYNIKHCLERLVLYNNYNYIERFIAYIGGNRIQKICGDQYLYELCLLSKYYIRLFYKYNINLDDIINTTIYRIVKNNIKNNINDYEKAYDICYLFYNNYEYVIDIMNYMLEYAFKNFVSRSNDNTLGYPEYLTIEEIKTTINYFKHNNYIIKNHNYLLEITSKMDKYYEDHIYNYIYNDYLKNVYKEMKLIVPLPYAVLQIITEYI